MTESLSVDELLALDTDEESVAISDDEYSGLLDKEEGELSDSQSEYTEGSNDKENITDFILDEKLDYEPSDVEDDDNDLIVNVTEEDMFGSDEETVHSNSSSDKVEAVPVKDDKISLFSNEVSPNQEVKGENLKFIKSKPIIKKKFIDDQYIAKGHPRPSFTSSSSQQHTIMKSSKPLPPPRFSQPPPPIKSYPKVTSISIPPPQNFRQRISHSFVRHPPPPPNFVKPPPCNLPPPVQSSPGLPLKSGLSTSLPSITRPASNFLPSSREMSNTCLEPSPILSSLSLLTSSSPGLPPSSSISLAQSFSSSLSPTSSPSLTPSSSGLPATLLSRVRERLSSPSPPMVCWHSAHIMKEAKSGLDIPSVIYSWHLYHASTGFKEKAISRLSDRFKEVKSLLVEELCDTVGSSGDGGGQLSFRFGCLAMENLSLEKVVLGKRKRDDELPPCTKQKIMRRLGVKPGGQEIFLRRERFGEVDMNFFDNVKYLSDKWRK